MRSALHVPRRRPDDGGAAHDGRTGGARTGLVRAIAVLATLAVAGSAATGSYTVRRDDTLSGIASRHGISTRSLVTANGLSDPDRVVAGRRLTIPSPGAASGPLRATAPAGASTSAYTIRSGDTLSHIAARTGVSERSLVAANGLTDPDRLAVGRTLTIPSGSAPAVPATAAGSSRASGAGGYTVRNGDTLSGIAVRLGVSSSALARTNGIGDPDRLTVGRTLAVPGAAAATSATSARASSARASSTAPAGLPARLRQSPQRLAYLPTFDRWAAHYGVPADLLKAMTWVESGWQQGAISSTGAIGIGQIMPDTHAWLRDIVIGERLDPHDPDDNIRMSARYLRWLLDRTGGDVRLALAGYYQGLHAVQTRGVYGETERYVANILAYRDRHF